MTRWGSVPYIYYTHLDILFCEVSGELFGHFCIKLSTSFSKLFSVCIVAYCFEISYVYLYKQI